MQQLLISVGKAHDSSLASLINEYTDRLARVHPTRWQLISPSGGDELTARRVESAAVLAKLQVDDYVVLLDERGQELSSEALSRHYEAWVGTTKRLVFVIGGAYGVDESLRQRADFTWSLSQHVFPHQIARLLLVEQLYRAHCISVGHPYHHK